MWRLVRIPTAANYTANVTQEVAVNVTQEVAANVTQGVAANLTLIVEKGWALVKAGGEEGPASEAAEDHNNSSLNNSNDHYDLTAKGSSGSYPGKRAF